MNILHLNNSLCRLLTEEGLLTNTHELLKQYGWKVGKDIGDTGGEIEHFYENPQLEHQRIYVHTDGVSHILKYYKNRTPEEGEFVTIPHKDFEEYLNDFYGGSPQQVEESAVSQTASILHRHGWRPHNSGVSYVHPSFPGHTMEIDGYVAIHSARKPWIRRSIEHEDMDKYLTKLHNQRFQN